MAQEQNSDTGETSEQALDNDIQKWIREYGQVAVFRAEGRRLVFRPPDWQAYHAFVDAATNDKASKAIEMRNLVVASVLWPSRAELDQLFRRLPGLPMAIGGKIVEMAGAIEEGEILKA